MEIFAEWTFEVRVLNNNNWCVWITADMILVCNSFCVPVPTCSGVPDFCAPVKTIAPAMSAAARTIAMGIPNELFAGDATRTDEGVDVLFSSVMLRFCYEAKLN